MGKNVTAFGGIGLLNPDDEVQEHVLQHHSLPNMYLFHHPKQHKQLLEVVLPVSLRLISQCSLYLATPQEARHIMEDKFKIRDGDLPALVFEDVMEHRTLVKRRWNYDSVVLFAVLQQGLEGVTSHKEEL